MNLTKENLVQEIIAKNGLVISEATLKTDDLLSTYYQLIKDYHLSGKVMNEISQFFDEEPTTINYFYGVCHIFREKEEEAREYLNDFLYDFFNEICPEGYYFGNTEGDGACFGFFKCEEEDEKEWNIPVTWSVCGMIKVKAKSLEEAMSIFDNNPDDFDLPDNSDYVDGSFELSSKDVEINKTYNQ